MEARNTFRHPILVRGRYRMPNGVRRDISVVDLSEAGCKLNDPRTILVAGMRVSLRIETIGPFDATVRWAYSDFAGIEFDNPLYGPVFEHIRSQLDDRDWRDADKLENSSSGAPAPAFAGLFRGALRSAI